MFRKPNKPSKPELLKQLPEALSDPLEMGPCFPLSFLPVLWRGEQASMTVAPLCLWCILQGHAADGESEAELPLKVF